MLKRQKGHACRQAGFAPIIILLGILILSLVVGAIYYFKNATSQPMLQISFLDNIFKSNESIKFNFIFKYGPAPVMALTNGLNTFDKTYRKDMVLAPSVKTSMSLSGAELNEIRRKMLEINFFDYPDMFYGDAPTGESLGEVTPCESYYFKVTDDSETKELSWSDCVQYKNDKSEKLRELIQYIKNVIESRPEYKKLPPAQGGYI